MIRLLFWLLLIAVTFVYSYLYSGSGLQYVSLFLFFLVLLIPAGNLFLSRLLCWSTQENKFCLKNRGPFRYEKIKITATIHHTFSDYKKTLSWTCFLNPGEERSYDIRDWELGVGPNTITITACRFPGLIFAFPCRISCPDPCTIHQEPVLCTTGIEITPEVWSFHGDSTIYQEEAGQDHSQVYEIRPYLPGDRLQQIHWSLSVRKDELLVKEWSKPDYPRLLFLLSPHTDYPATPEDFDRFFGVLLAFSLALIQEGCCHEIAWLKGEEFRRIILRDMESFYRFRHEIMEIPWHQYHQNIPCQLTLPQWFKASNPNDSFAAIYQWSLDGALTLDEVIISRWSKKNWPRELQDKGQVF